MKDSNLTKGYILQGADYSYRIEGVLGQGSFGITYLATTKAKIAGPLGKIETEVKVAVKEFFMREFCSRREDGTLTEMTDGSLVQNYSRKFRKEAENLAKLSHPGIVNVLEVFDANNTCYYAMQYISGSSLDAYVKSRGCLSEDEAVACIRQIGEAVQYMHDHKMLHLDLKPGNVMRGEDGKKMVLIDFGLSKQYSSNGEPESSTTIGLGTPGYAPIEQSNADRDRDFAPTLDVYALGATFFKLLTGETPPKASDVLNEGLPIEKLRQKGVSQKSMDAIEKAMEPRKGRRLQDVQSFLNKLSVDSPDEEQTEVHKPKPVPKPSPKPVRKGFPKWLYGLIAGIVVAVLAVVLMNRPDSHSATDNQLADSTAVVAEAVAEKPVTSKPSASASKPETPAKSEAPSVVELKSISLNKTALELEEGGSATLTVQYSPNNATNKSTTWKSSNTSVVKVNGNGKVTAAKAGTATIIASCGGKDAYCNVTVKAKEVQPTPSSVSSTAASASTPSSSLSSTTGTHNGHEWVDLGLSVKWATCNVGASSPEDYGDYFAWGETSPKSEYTYANLKYHTEGDSEDNVKFSKYVKKSKYGQVDFKRALEYSDDAARANWGGSWRMPNEEECRELMNACTWTWTTMNGKNGYKVVSKSNGNSIFFPAAGMRYDTVFRNVGTEGYYWSCSLDDHGRDGHAFSIHFDLENNYYLTALRRNGLSVRPVFYR